MAVDRQSLLFFITVFVFLSLLNNNEQPFWQRETLSAFQKNIQFYQQQLHNSQYYLGYQNITGFLLSYNDAKNDKKPEDWPLHQYSKESPWKEDEEFSILPNEISDEVKDFWGLDASDDTSYLFNVSGSVHGQFEREKSDFVRQKLVLPEYLQNYYNSVFLAPQPDSDSETQEPPRDPPRKQGDLKALNGKITISMENRNYNFQDRDFKIGPDTADTIDDAVLLKMSINLYDNSEVEQDQIRATGIYFQKTGSIVSVTNTAKFLGEFTLPMFTMNEENYKTAQKLIDQFLNGTKIILKLNMEDMNSLIGKSMDQCELVSYIQLEKTPYSSDELRLIDEELLNPQGYPLPSELPKIEVKKMVMFSPDCGFVLSNKGMLTGDRAEVVTGQMRRVMVMGLILVGTQLYLFMNQIKRISTPGALSSVSFLTLIMFQYQEIVNCILLLLVSIYFTGLFLLVSAIVLILFITFFFFEIGFLDLVYGVQVNENGTTWWEILRGSMAREELPRPVTDPVQNSTNDAAAPAAPAAPATPAAPAAPTVETVPTTPGPMGTGPWNPVFGPTVALAVISTFLVINASTWRSLYRRVFEMVGFTIINSYWIPQFFRNTLKNRKTPFSWNFILGISFVRVSPVVYINLFTNPLRHGRNPKFAVFLVSYMGLQMLLLVLQNGLGPRFWVNEKWLPKAYDYHPILNVKDLEHGFGSDLLASIGVQELLQNDNVINCKTDCAICMAEVSLPIYKQETRKKSDGGYMITPCFHIFHSECLQDWMKYKLQCPVCRNGLPPV